MKTIKLVVELTYDEDMMHSDHEDDIKWFKNDILLQQNTNEKLILHSNEIGDSVGEIKVLEIVSKTNQAALNFY